MINRVNPSYWWSDDLVKHDPINALDQNAASRLDKRDGYFDTLASTISVDGYVNFAADGYLDVDTGANVFIADGTLKTGASIIGNFNGTLPFGFIDVLVTAQPASGSDTASQTLTASQTIYYNIRLSGTLAADTIIILPTYAGYSKAVDNQTTSSDGYRILLQTANGTKQVEIISGNADIVYCDGIDIVRGVGIHDNNVISIQTLKETTTVPGFAHVYTVPSVLGEHLVNTSENGNYSITFTDVQVGDIFDINLEMAHQYSHDGGLLKFYIKIANPSVFSILNETMLINDTYTNPWNQYAQGGVSASYVAKVAANVIIRLYANLVIDNSGQGAIMAPCSLSVRQIRP